MSAASAANARQIYNVAQWSDGYFDIDDNGHLVVQPRHDASSRLPLAELVEEIRAHGLALPVLVVKQAPSHAYRRVLVALVCRVIHRPLAS